MRNGTCGNYRQMNPPESSRVKIKIKVNRILTDVGLLLNLSDSSRKTARIGGKIQSLRHRLTQTVCLLCSSVLKRK